MGLVYKAQNDTRTEQLLSDGTIVYTSAKAPDRPEGQRITQFNLQYPINITGSPEYGVNHNRVVFLINVSGNTNMSRPANPAGPDGLAIDARTSIDYRNLQTGVQPSSPAANGGQTNGTQNGSINTIKTGLSNIPGINRIGMLKQMKRLSAAIVLYMPNSIQNTYSVNWETEDIYNLQMIAGFAGAGLAAATGISPNDVVGALQPGMQRAVKTAGVAAGAVAAAATSNYAQQFARMTTGNSKAEQLFKGVDFRTFNFDYEFSPKSQDEAAAVLDIIRMFRHHMLPEFWDSANFMYIYPQEFEVKYFSGTVENPYLEKQMTAVLTQCQVNYTPDGQFNTFANGMPTKIKMTLQFKELALPTKEVSHFDRQGI